jgi:copper chaperone CopZ
MKNYGVVIAVLFCLLSSSLLQAQSVRTRSIRMVVDGMVCSFCAQGLVKIFKQQKGVVNLQVSLEDRALLLYIQEETELPEEEIKELVKNAGYKVNSITFLPTN